MGVAMQLVVDPPVYGPEYADRAHPPPLRTRFAATCNCPGVCVVEEGGLLRCVSRPIRDGMLALRADVADPAHATPCWQGDPGQ